MSKKEIKKNNKSGKWYVNISKVIAWPFVMIATALKNIWIWICKINLVGLANCALLVAIIVLFSVLIMDFIGCQKKQAIVATAPVPFTLDAVPSDHSTVPAVSSTSAK